MIVFVAFGAVPEYAADAIAQARRASPATPILLLTDSPPPRWRRFGRSAPVDLYDLDALRRDPRLDEFRRRPDNRDRFRRGFWRHTTGRFLALRALMERERIESATHLENDVLLYAPLPELAAWAPFAGPALATVFESSDRAIPGIVRIGSRDALDRFADFILNHGHPLPPNDMQLVAAFRRAEQTRVADLPTVPPRPDAHSPVTRSLFGDRAPEIPMAPGRWLFDGARFGQYLGGIDPRNEPRRLRRWVRWQRGELGHPNGFINESGLDNPADYRYGLSRRGALTVPVLIDQGVAFPMATLHVHSKKLRRFTSAALEQAE